MQDEQNNPQNTPQMPPEQPEHKPMGPMVGIIIIILILILGGFYFWGQRLIKEGVFNENGEATLSVEEALDQAAGNDAALESLGNVSSSDEIGVLENDADATDLKSLEDGLSDIDASLGL